MLNNLILFLKNGFHSYTVDMVREALMLKGMNVAAFGMWPGFLVLLSLIWWIWAGHRRSVELLREASAE